MHIADEGVDVNGDHIKYDKQERGKTKDQSEELVERKLVTQEGQSQAIFLNASLSTELR